jgi:hypothetical protein
MTDRPHDENLWKKYQHLFSDEQPTDDVPDDGILHSHDKTFGKLPAVLIHDTGITDGAKVLYAHMHWRYGRNRKNFEGRAKMAQHLGVTETTITKRIQELEAAHWIVVIERGRSDKGGAYQTPFYHIFESQDDAEYFRFYYKPKEGETVRPRSYVEPRKSRKGKGGNPKLKAASTQVHGVNSSSHGAVNSSSHYPEAFDLDSISLASGDAVRKVQSKSQTVRSKPISQAEQHPERTEAEWAVIRQQRIDESMAQGNREAARQKNFAELEKAVKVLPGVSGKLATQYAHMINGTATKGVYAEYRIVGGITAVEFEAFLGWYGRHYPKQGIPKEVEKLYGYIMEWIDCGKPTGYDSNGNGHKPQTALDRAYSDVNGGVE